MKHKINHLQSLVTVALCIIMAMAFTSCSDDDEPATNDLTSNIIGVWAQDGDNDILVINKGGTGAGYESPADYYDNEPYGSIAWEYKNDFVYIDIDFYDFVQREKLKAVSVSKNEIKWLRYETDENDNFTNEYEEWTWTRYEQELTGTILNIKSSDLTGWSFSFNFHISIFHFPLNSCLSRHITQENGCGGAVPIVGNHVRCPSGRVRG